MVRVPAQPNAIGWDNSLIHFFQLTCPESGKYCGDDFEMIHNAAG